MSEIVPAPVHLRKKTPFSYPHAEMNINSGRRRMQDPYDYMRNNLSKEEEKTFMDKEQGFF